MPVLLYDWKEEYPWSKMPHGWVYSAC
jgi:hypothetical protein